MQYNTAIQHNAMQYNTIHCSEVAGSELVFLVVRVFEQGVDLVLNNYSTTRCSTVQYTVLQYNTVRCSTIQYTVAKWLGLSWCSSWFGSLSKA